MPAKNSHSPRGSSSGRAASLVLVCAYILLIAFPTPGARAIEIFGFKLFEPDVDDTVVADPLRYDVTLTVVGDDKMQDDLEDVSNLVADEERPVSGSLGLISKARRERETLVAALYERARYEGVVDIMIEGKPIDAIPPDAEFGNQPVSVAITITPGPTFVLGDVALDGDAAGLDPADFGLEPGGDAGSTIILRAERDIVKELKKGGMPLAQVANREVVADHATSTLDVKLDVQAGAVAGYGETTVEGTNEVERDFVEYMAGLRRGETYSPDDVEEARERLLELGVFSSVGVREAEALDENGQIPMTVAVTERKARYYGIGASYSTTEGAGIEGYWGHRNLFGRAEKLRIEGSISRIGDTTDYGKLNYNAAIMFEKPGVIGPPSKFFANVKSAFEHPDAYDRFSVKAGVGVAYDITRAQNVSAELAVEYSDIEDVFGSDRHLIVSVPLQYTLDRRDNRLDPKEGFRFQGLGEPGFDFLTTTTFVKLRGDLSAYQSVDAAGRFVIAGRISGGSILGADVDDMPADKRFYAGGGGSVRGYSYQGIGPKDPATGDPTGGLSFAEASAELRIAINDNFGVVPFIDAGTVSQRQFPDFADVKIGAGIGIRYLTPFGPLRLDVGVPLNPDPGDPVFGIYAGVGQAF